MQLGILTSIIYSSNLLKKNNYLDSDSQLLETASDKISKSRFDIIKSLLEYGCDPNRGVVLSNKRKFIIENYLDINFPNEKSKPSEPVDKNSIERRFSIKSHNLEDENHEAELSTFGTTVTLTDRGSLKIRKQRNELLRRRSSINPSNFTTLHSSSSILNTDLSTITSTTEPEHLNLLYSTPIDTPLLIVCCLYNCHNILSLSQSSDTALNHKQKKQAKEKKFFKKNSHSMSLSSNLKAYSNSIFHQELNKYKSNKIEQKNELTDQKRRNTIQVDKENMPFAVSSSGSVCSTAYTISNASSASPKSVKNKTDHLFKHWHTPDRLSSSSVDFSDTYLGREVEQEENEYQKFYNIEHSIENEVIENNFLLFSLTT